MNIQDFFSTDLREFSHYACQRAIPSGIDGLKPSQRKVLFGMKKEFPSYNTEVKVSIASASIMGVSAYHHGSLDSVMIGMAQSFPGANNIPLLDEIGQFGNRISPVAAASRYIFTRISKLGQELFNDLDEAILTHQEEEGQSIEPKFYLPLLPIVLVNGASGMGVGYSTSVMQYSPSQLREHMIALLKGKKPNGKLTPWFDGFTGTIEPGVGNQWIVRGKFEIVNTTTIKITELPVGDFTIKYREVLNDLEDKGVIKSYDDLSTDTKIEFVLNVPRETTKLPTEKLMSLFKLVSKNTENIVIWDENDRIKQFETADDLLVWFTDYRLGRIKDRIQFIIQNLESKQSWLREQAAFISYYLKNAKSWSMKSTKEIKEELSEIKFITPANIPRLLDIRISRLTNDSITELESDIKKTQEDIDYHKTCDSTEYFINELKALTL